MEQEVFIDSVWIECAQLKNEFLFEIFAAFCVSVVYLNGMQLILRQLCHFFLHLVGVCKSGPPIFSLFRH